MEKFAYHFNTNKTGSADACRIVSPETVANVHAFHRGMKGYYEETPLRELSNKAKSFGLKALFVKDESKRFGLNAFKGLGGSYAAGKYLCDKLGISADEFAYGKLTSPQAHERLGENTFVTATDGNHGRGVAWIAKVLGYQAVVYMPQGSAPERLENIRALGAHAEILSCNYDDAVRHAAKMAEEHGWVLMQDTAWDGYEEIPTHIMQGYTTLAAEAAEQMRERGMHPTHLFLQAGVGSMAGAIAGYFKALLKENCPMIIIVEPDKADCIYRTAKANDGKLHIVTGDMDSIMAGLCCGEPCTVSWEILKNTADVFISCADVYTENGMRMLGRPIGDDPKIISGESGAVTAGVLQAIMTEKELEPLKEHLGLNEDSCVLLISTEGDTDKENYKKILG